MKTAKYQAVLTRHSQPTHSVKPLFIKGLRLSPCTLFLLSPRETIVHLLEYTNTGHDYTAPQPLLHKTVKQTYRLRLLL